MGNKRERSVYFNADKCYVREPSLSALIFKANFTASSKNSATFTKSASRKPLEVRAGVPKKVQNTKFIPI